MRSVIDFSFIVKVSNPNFFTVSTLILNCFYLFTYLLIYFMDNLFMHELIQLFDFYLFPTYYNLKALALSFLANHLWNIIPLK